MERYTVDAVLKQNHLYMDYCKLACYVWASSSFTSVLKNDRSRHSPEKITWPSHNALLSVGYFVQVVMWVISDKNLHKMQDWDDF